MTAPNKEAALSFLQRVVEGNISEAYDEFVAPDMRHHNAYFAGDAESLKAGMEENHREHPNKIFEVQRALAEGDIVAVHSHVRMSADDRGVAVVHILRFEDARIAEMWDLGQPVPEDSPNEHGMF